jgi:hypothetical protein
MMMARSFIAPFRGGPVLLTTVSSQWTIRERHRNHLLL